MKNFNKKKAVVLLTAIALLLAAAVGGTVAYLIASTASVVNTFTPTSIGTDIVEEFSGNVKTNVQIRNTGTVDAYIRAKVVITWQDAQGNIHAQKPEAGKDYEIVWGESGGWTKYNTDVLTYFKSPVSANDITHSLINSCTLKEGAVAPEGYTLHVEILTQAIQAVPRDVVIDVWDVNLDSSGHIVS